MKLSQSLFSLAPLSPPTSPPKSGVSLLSTSWRRKCHLKCTVAFLQSLLHCFKSFGSHDACALTILELNYYERLKIGRNIKLSSNANVLHTTTNRSFHAQIMKKRSCNACKTTVLFSYWLKCAGLRRSCRQSCFKLPLFILLVLNEKPRPAAKIPHFQAREIRYHPTLIVADLSEVLWSLRPIWLAII